MASLIKFGFLSILASSALAVPHGSGRKTRTKSSSVSAGPYSLGNSTGVYAATGTAPSNTKNSIPTTTAVSDDDSPVGGNSACGTALTTTETAFQTITISVTASGSGADISGQQNPSTTVPYPYSNGTTSDILSTAGPTGTGFASASGSSVAQGHSGIHSARSSSRAAASSSASVAASSSASVAASSSASVAASSLASAAASSLASAVASSSFKSAATSSTPALSSTLASSSTSAAVQVKTTSTAVPAASYAMSSSIAASSASSSAAKSSSVVVDAEPGSTTASTSPSAPTPTITKAEVQTGSGTGKRGLAYTDGKLTSSWPSGGQVSWGYNWSPNSNGLNSAFTHVPMLWGTRSVDIGPWKGLADAAVKNNVKYFLGFNEPNNKGQSNISPQDAANAWRTHLEPYAKLGVKLGAPAIDNGPTGIQWLKDFLNACSGCTIDFVPFHWYDSATNYAYFKNHIADVYKAGGNRPLWLTEFAGNGDAAAQKNFLQKVMPWLDQNPQVERYSWFLVQDGSLMSGNALSELGKTFATYTSSTIPKEML